MKGDPFPSLPEVTLAASLNFRAPTTSPTLSSTFTPPSVSFMQGKWHVTHSTLPMWKKNQNVTITYKSLPENAEMLDDLVEYQPLNSTNNKKIQGIDSPDAQNKGVYNWRGKGLLVFVSSRWEVLGCGEEDGGWAVTYFQKTIFTPAGIDLYARQGPTLPEGLFEKIKEGLATVQDPDFQALVASLFPVKHDP